MSKERKRSIKTAQLKMRMLNLILNGTPGTPVAIGFDRFGVSSVTDNGVGDYTVIFKNPFERACQCAGLAIITADCIGIVTAVASDRITVKTFDATDGTTAKEADMYLNVIGSDARYDV